MSVNLFHPAVPVLAHRSGFLFAFFPNRLGFGSDLAVAPLSRIQCSATLLTNSVIHVFCPFSSHSLRILLSCSAQERMVS